MNESYRPESATPQSAAGGRFAVLAVPGALQLWLAGIAVNIVRWLEMLAFALIAFEASGSPFLVTLTAFARLAPMLTASVTISLIDGYDRRRVLIVLCVVLLVMDLSLLVLTLSGHLAVWHLLVAAVVSGLCWTIENPVRRTMLAEVAGSERVNAAMSLDVASNQAMRGVGPALGGLLIELSGTSGVFIFGVVLHAAAILLILAVAASPASSTAVGGPSLLRSIGQTFAYVRRHRTLIGTMAITAIFNMFGFPYVSLAPVIGETVLGLSPFGIGLLLAAEALAACLTSMLIVASFRPSWYVPAYTLGAAGFMVCTLLYALSSSAAFAYATLMIAGIGMAAFASMQMTIPLQASPPQLRVRMLGLVTVCIGASTLGFLNAGWLAEWLGPAMAQRVMSIEGLLAIALIVWKWPEMLRFRAPRPLDVKPSITLASSGFDAKK